MPNFALLCRHNPNQPDGIWDYTQNLASALIATDGINVDIHARLVGGGWLTMPTGRTRSLVHVRRKVEDGLDRYDVIILQYNPFMYGRWGFAPWLPAALHIGRRTRHTRLALMIHENYMPMLNWRWTLMGLWQRAQLLALRFDADVIFVSNQVWAARIANSRLRRDVHHLPVGSNLPDRRVDREAQRRKLGIPPGAIVLATFGQNHHSRLAEYIVRAANAAVTAGHGPVVLMNLGDGLKGLTGLDVRVSLYSSGYLPAEPLARYLSVADIYLAPFIDGVSTRRTTLMSALQHGLAIVGTQGPLTDPLLVRSQGALSLVPVGRPDTFAEAVGQLATAPEARRRLGERARSLYESCFDWPILARRLTRALGYDGRPIRGLADDLPTMRTQSPN